MVKKPGNKVRGSATGRPLMVLLDVLGQRWALRIMWELRSERLTFRQLQERCDNVSPTSLNRRLKELRELDLVDHSDNGFGHTRWGKELAEHFIRLDQWSEVWAKGR